MKIAYIGNFEPEHSTENHVKRAITNNAHDVVPYQERDVAMWDKLIEDLRFGTGIDFILWTRTVWDPPISYDKMRVMQDAARAAGVPTVSFHLDRWWGLNREREVRESPFFKNDLVITADGGHDDLFWANGTNHLWMSPGVSLDECERTPNVRPEFQHDIVFCGSSHGYHAEWSYRLELVRWLEGTFGTRLGVYPKDQPALRGQDLVDLYGSAKVMVGDSCLNGNITNYWSDRIPETLGRGGFLIHPHVPGIEDYYTDGEHLVLYELGNFGQLKELIEYYVANDAARNVIAAAGKAHVMQNHTYERRVEQVIAALQDRSLL